MGGARKPSSPLTHFPQPGPSSTTTGTGTGCPGCQMAEVPLSSAGLAVGWGKPPAPHPALLLQHPGPAKPGGSLLGRRPGADLLAAPGGGILPAAALAPVTPPLRAPVTLSVPIPSLGPPQRHWCSEMDCGPQRDLPAPMAAWRLGSGWWDGNPICPPSPGPQAEEGDMSLAGEHASATMLPTELPPAIPRQGAAMRTDSSRRRPIPNVCLGNVNIFRSSAPLKSAQDGANRSPPPPQAASGASPGTAQPATKATHHAGHRPPGKRGNTSMVLAHGAHQHGKQQAQQRWGN